MSLDPCCMFTHRLVFSADLMDGLRQIPGREAIKLRAEVSQFLFISLMFKLYCGERSFKVAFLQSLGGFHDFAPETEEDCIEQKDHENV